MSMRYKLLGNSGLRVSEICLGTMTFGEDWGWGASKDECAKIIDRYLNAGGNFIDTSVNYTNGSSESIVGDLVNGARESFVIATKYSLTSKPDDPNAGGNHRKNMTQSLRTSLERLKTDYVDLLWLHMWDYTTPIEEVMRSLDALVRSGKVLHLGASDTPAWVVAKANGIAESRGWTPFSAIQVPYNLADRDAERELLPMARSLGLASLAWAPLAAGLLTGKYTRKPSPQMETQGRLNRPDWGVSERSMSIARAVDRVADESGHSSAAVAINWLRRQSGTIIPIVGATKASQMEEDLSCLDFQLTDDQIARLDESNPTKLGFPGDFLSSEGVRALIFGSTFGRIDIRSV